MDAKSNAHVQWCNQLQHHGWDVDFADSIKSNEGSESLSHVVAKTVAFHYLKNQGYRVKSEVVHTDGRGVVDLIAIAQTTEEHPIAIELENNLTEEVRDDKLQSYAYKSPIRDVLFVRVEDLPTDIHAIKTQIAEAIGL